MRILDLFPSVQRKIMPLLNVELPKRQSPNSFFQHTPRFTSLQLTFKMQFVLRFALACASVAAFAPSTVSRSATKLGYAVLIPAFANPPTHLDMDAVEGVHTWGGLKSRPPPVAPPPRSITHRSNDRRSRARRESKNEDISSPSTLRERVSNSD